MPKKTTKPVIALKNLKHSKSLSQETPAYTATIWVDGRRFAEVSNHGTGGPDCYDRGDLKEYFTDTTNSAAYPSLESLEKRIAETFPRHSYDFGGDAQGEYPESLESVCHTLVYDECDRKELRRMLRNAIFSIEDGGLYKYPTKPGPMACKAILEDKPEATVLNSLSFEDAWSAYKCQLDKTK
jgi:hypothetical protein